MPIIADCKLWAARFRANSLAVNVAKHRPVPTDMERIQPSTILALIAVWICVGASLASSADEIGL